MSSIRKRALSLCLSLALPTLIVTGVYSLLKRLTPYCHYWLGASLGLAPLAGWLSVDPSSLGLAPLLLDSLLCLPLPDALVPMPLPLPRLRQRGYNQVQELALATGHLLELPVRPELLLRPSCDTPQSRLRAEERRRNLHGSFIASPDAAGLRLWLLDDIFTTGSTARAAAQALRAAGARRIDLVTLARTPLHPAGR